MKLSLPKKELLKIAVLFFLLILLFKAVFYKETFAGLFKLVFGLYWVLLLPGYALVLAWKNSLPFIIRLIVGSALAAAITGTVSYYLGLAGLNLKYHIYFLPVALILIGGYVYCYYEQRRIRQD